MASKEKKSGSKPPVWLVWWKNKGGSSGTLRLNIANGIFNKIEIVKFIESKHNLPAGHTVLTGTLQITTSQAIEWDKSVGFYGGKHGE